MKECKYCGAECLDNATRCPNCGGDKFYTAKEINSEMKRQEKEEQNQVNQVTTPEIDWKKILKVLFVIVAGIIAVILFVTLINNCSRNDSSQREGAMASGSSIVEKNGKDEGEESFENAQRCYDNGDIEYAIVLLSQVSQSSVKYDEAQSLLGQYIVEYQSSVIKAAEQYASKGDYTSAIDIINNAISIIGSVDELTDMLTTLENQYSEKVDARIQSYLSDENFDAAFELIETSKKYIRDRTITSALYGKVYDAYQQYVATTVNTYVNNSQFKIALEYLSGACERFPNDSTFQDLYESTMSSYKMKVRSDTIASANEYVAKNDYLSAINILNKAIREIGDDAELSAQLKVYEATYSAMVIKEARDQYVEYNAESIIVAETILKTALEVLPGNNDLLSELEFYYAIEPTDIMTLPLQPYFDNDLEFVGEVVDNTGVKHSKSLHLKYYTKIDVDYQYSKVTGIFFQSQKYASSPIEHRFMIYGSYDGCNWDEDNPIWTGKVSGNSSPLVIDADISGWKYLIFEYSHFDSDNDYHCYLADVYVWR